MSEHTLEKQISVLPVDGSVFILLPLVDDLESLWHLLKRYCSVWSFKFLPDKNFCHTILFGVHLKIYIYVVIFAGTKKNNHYTVFAHCRKSWIASRDRNDWKVIVKVPNSHHSLWNPSGKDCNFPSLLKNYAGIGLRYIQYLVAR